MIRKAKIGAIAEVNPKIPFKVVRDQTATVSFIPMAGVSEDGTILAAEERKCSDVIKGYRYFESRDVLLAKITPCFENGKAAFLDQLPNSIGFGSTEFHVLRPGKGVDPKYLFYLIWNPYFRSFGRNNMTGTAGQKRLPADFVKRFEIPLPPLPEQKRIAAILDKADAIRRKRQQAIKLADEFLRSAFLDMFGDPVTNPKGWETLALKHVGHVTTGSTPPSIKEGMFGGTIPFITPGDIENNGDGVMRFLTEEGAKNSRTVRSGTTLVCCIGATIGKVGMTKLFSAFNQQINAVEWDESVNDLYGYWAMRFLKILVVQRAITTTLPILKKSEFEEIEIPRPPLKIQRNFEKMAKLTSQLIAVQKRSHSQSTTLFQSLTQLAFRGEL